MKYQQKDIVEVSFLFPDGTYKPHPAIIVSNDQLQSDDKTKLYLGAENTLYYPEADVPLGAFRCYFELLGGLTAGDHPNEVNAFNLNFGDNDASAIKDVQSMVNVQSSMFNVQWYTLDGRRLNGMPTQRGIYIVGGKKVVIK